MSYDVVSFGSATVDLFVASDEFALHNGEEGVLLCSSYGDKIDVDTFELVSGGGGTNTACHFAGYGLEAAVVAEMGTDVPSETVLRDLRARGVSMELLVQEKREKTGMSVILLGPDGGRTILVHRGAASMLEVRDIPWEQVSTADWWHLSSLSGNMDLVKELLQTAARQKVRVSWNPGSGEIAAMREAELDLDLEAVEIVFFNRQEWQACGDIQQHLCQNVPFIVITAGKEGGRVMVREGDEVEFHGAAVDDVVDETGAGDAFASGFVAAQLQEKTLEQSIDQARDCARSVITHFGAKVPLTDISREA